MLLPTSTGKQFENGEDDEAIDARDEGPLHGHDDACDFGLGAGEPGGGRTVRVKLSAGAATSLTCSCQFGTSWGLPACRHIFCVAVLLQLESFPASSYQCKWQPLDLAKHAELLRRMLTAPQPVAVPLALTPDRALTDPKARQALLMVHVRQLLDIGAQSDSHMREVEGALTAALQSLRLGTASTGQRSARRVRRWHPTHHISSCKELRAQRQG